MLLAPVGVLANDEPAAPASDSRKLSEALIYSVDRTPERTFDTARDVQVITQEEIQHLNVSNLAQLLLHVPGFAVLNGESGTMPFVRGLGGKQVLFLIDGVKVNNATWSGPSREYLYIFDLSQVDRIEIVRGVVSVLGTDSLGGVVNLITKKGTGEPKALTAGLATRYATAERSVDTTISAAGSTGRLRYDGGITYTSVGDIRGGSGVGAQSQTGYKQRGGHLNGQFLLSQERTVSFGYQNVTVEDQQTPPLGPPRGQLRLGEFDPATLELLSLSYLDLTSRKWEDSMRLTIFGNRQRLTRQVFTFPGNHNSEFDADSMMGLNLELGTFAGAHHLVYGLDLTDQSIDSTRKGVSAAGVVTFPRGILMDGASYRTESVYLQDRFDVGQWLTVIAGARAARYESSGTEDSRFGHIDLEAKRTNVTSALNLIGHVTPTLNVIANVVRGYRAPNLDDVSRGAPKPGIQEIPNPAAAPEKVQSFEAGVKYAGRGLALSAFYYKNKFRDLLVKVPSLLDGLPYVDTNGNGRRDPNESQIIQNQNVGEAVIDGVEADVSYRFSNAFSMSASYSRLVGKDEVANAPLSSMQPASGSLVVHYTPDLPRAPWVELGYRFTNAQLQLSANDITNVYIGPGGSAAYRVADLRAGMRLGSRAALSLALENALNEKYQYLGSNRFEPGRQLVLGTQFHF
jgi:outer membrane receptor protein involved in Fe transport